MTYTLRHKLGLHLTKAGDKKEIMIPTAAIKEGNAFVPFMEEYPLLVSEDGVKVKVNRSERIETYQWGMPEENIAALERTHPDEFKKTAYYKARELYKLKLSDYVLIWKRKLYLVGEHLILMEVERA